MNKILLVVLPYLLERGQVSSKMRSFAAFPYGLLSMATYANNKSNNVKIQVFDCNTHPGEYYLNSLIRKLNEMKPNIIGISMMFDNSYNHVTDITTAIKQYDNEAIIVMGGAATRSSYKTIIEEQKDINAICFSEGELPFLNLVESTNPISVLNTEDSWITREKIKSQVTPSKSHIQDLDEVIDIDYSLVNIDDYSMKESFSPFVRSQVDQRQFFIITSRGCPFKCAFCMRSVDNDRSMRYATVDKVISHVKNLVENYGLTVLTIYDDQILFNKKRAKEIFKELAQFNIRVECPNGLSVAFIDDEMAKLMKNAGMDTIQLAIESGSPYVLKYIIDKPLNHSMVKSVIDRLRKYDFWIYGSFVIGFPGETDAHRDETLRFINQVGLDWSGFCPAVPYRGTKLYNLCIEHGYIRNDIGIGEFDSSNYFINTPEYSPEYITKKIYSMNLNANFVNNYRMKHGDYAVAANAFSEVIQLYNDHAFAHYFLAKALKKMGCKDDRFQKSMNTFHELVDNNEMWKEYAKDFGLL